MTTSDEGTGEDMGDDTGATTPPLTLDAEEMRALGYQVVDQMVRHWEGVAKGPVWRKAGRAEMEALLREPPPEAPGDPAALLRLLEEDVLPQSGQLIHPRFYGFIPSPSNFVSVLADALAAAHNPFAGNWMEASGPAMVELVALDWLRELLGLPEGAGGLFVSGGSVANLTGLALARMRMLDAHGTPITQGVVYCSDQTHSSALRGLRVLGLLPEQTRRIPSENFRLPLAALREAVAQDRMAKDGAAGRVPFCVIANAGTTNTGAVDPLGELADYCAAEDLWLHVDGAHGAAAALHPEARPLLAGMERAHSLAIDPHKWLFQPYETGCLLVREQRWLPEAFHVMPEYLKDTVGLPDEVNFMDHGIQLTRGFRALKFWLSVKTFGLGAFREAIGQGLHLAAQAEAWLRDRPHWQVVAPASLAILCFRYNPPGLDDDAIDALNLRMAEALNAGGHAFLSTTALHGRPVLRICPINPRGSVADLLGTLERLEALGEELAAG